MKTRIVLKSFDALSYGVLLSKAEPPLTGDNNCSFSTTKFHPPQPKAVGSGQYCCGGGHAVALPAASVWAGLKQGPLASSALNYL
jgi:hypothetical protein